MTSLTKTQRRYLDTIRERGHLRYGWGGYKSTRTVRILEEKGLIRLIRLSGGGWTASLTSKGSNLLGGF